MREPRRGLAAAALFLAAAGCAKVADPEPPQRAVPTVQDLTAASDGRRVLLGFSLPDGEVSVLEAFVACGKDSPGKQDFQLLAAVPTARLVPARDAPGRYTFTTPERVGSPCFYRLRFANPSGRRSGFSNAARVP